MRDWKENNLEQEDLLEVRVSSIFRGAHTRPIIIFALEDNLNRVLPVYTEMQQDYVEGIEKIKIFFKEGVIISKVFVKNEIKEMDVGRSVFLAYINRADIFVSREIMDVHGIKIPDEREVLEIQIDGLKDYLRDLKLKKSEIRIYEELRDHLSQEIKILEDRLQKISEEED